MDGMAVIIEPAIGDPLWALRGPLRALTTRAALGCFEGMDRWAIGGDSPWKVP